MAHQLRGASPLCLLLPLLCLLYLLRQLRILSCSLADPPLPLLPLP